MFELTNEQNKQISSWIVSHNCPITYEGSIGGKITYAFTPTSLGVVEKAICGCGLFIDVTYYKDW